jgi:hypothetical protein
VVQGILITRVVWQMMELYATLNLILHMGEYSAKGEVHPIVISEEGITVCSSVSMKRV